MFRLTTVLCVHDNKLQAITGGLRHGLDWQCYGSKAVAEHMYDLHTYASIYGNRQIYEFHNLAASCPILVREGAAKMQNSQISGEIIKMHTDAFSSKRTRAHACAPSRKASPGV